MRSRFLAGLMLAATAMTNGPWAYVAAGGFVLVGHEVFAAETNPAEGGTVTPNAPVVIYGERVEPPVVPWYKRRLVWVIIAGLLGGVMLIEDDDNDQRSSDVPPGSLVVIGPPL